MSSSKSRIDRVTVRVGSEREKRIAIDDQRRVVEIHEKEDVKRRTLIEEEKDEEYVGSSDQNTTP